MTYLFCSPDSTGYRKTKNDARKEGGLFLFGERVVARVHEKFVQGFWSFHNRFVNFELFTTSFHRIRIVWRARSSTRAREIVAGVLEFSRQVCKFWAFHNILSPNPNSELFGERVAARVHEKFVSWVWSFHDKFVNFSQHPFTKSKFRIVWRARYSLRALEICAGVSELSNKFVNIELSTTWFHQIRNFEIEGDLFLFGERLACTRNLCRVLSFSMAIK